MDGATYEPTRYSLVDVARELLGQTDPATTRFSDLTIENAVGNFGWYEGVAHLATGLKNWYAQEADKFSQQGGQAFEFVSRVKAMDDLVADARARRIVPEPGTEPPVAAPTDGLPSMAYGTVVLP